MSIVTLLPHINAPVQSLHQPSGTVVGAAGAAAVADLGVYIPARAVRFSKHAVTLSSILIKPSVPWTFFVFLRVQPASLSSGQKQL